jgi:hypothetical protein
LEGVPKIVVSVNANTGIQEACRYEPDLNRTYQDRAAH